MNTHRHYESENNHRRYLFRFGGFSAYRSDIGDYMRRWILRTPWGMLRLHCSQRSDTDRALHDHPADFTSLILSGGYWETTGTHFVHGVLQKQTRWVGPGSIVRRKAEQLHRLTLPYEGASLRLQRAWTLVWLQEPWRDWGFLPDETGVWISHKDYEKEV